jgi:hypothetical protein
MMQDKKLQGKVVDFEQTNETFVDKDGTKFTKTILTVKLIRFAKKRIEGFEDLPKELKDKEVKLVRWTCYDWHLKVGALKTLTEEETRAVLEGKPINTVWW